MRWVRRCLHRLGTAPGAEIHWCQGSSDMLGRDNAKGLEMYVTGIYTDWGDILVYRDNIINTI